MRAMRSLSAALVVGAVVLAGGATALAADAPIDGTHVLPDRDVRKGQIRPTAAQRADARDVATQVAWNQFGTPSTLVDPGGSLATGVRGATPEAAARAWLAANKALFRLDSTDGFELQSDARLAGDVGHAVTLRQVVGGLDASGGGLVTIGVVRDDGWKVISASGTVHGDTTLAAKPELAPEQALQKAAANAGDRRSLAQITPVEKSAMKGFKGFKLAGRARRPGREGGGVPDRRPGLHPGLRDDRARHARRRAGGLPHVRRRAQRRHPRARERRRPRRRRGAGRGRAAAVLGRAARAGRRLRHRARARTASPPTRACGRSTSSPTPTRPRRTSSSSCSSETPSWCEADTGRTPERIRYAPAGGVPAGDYFVQVCEFQNGTPPVEPRTYTGTVTLDDSPPPAPYTARWNVFPGTPPHNALSANPWNNPDTDTREHWCWKASSNADDCDDIGGNLASRSPWDHDVHANTPSNTTIGNNARSGEGWADAGGPVPNPFRPVSVGRDYSFPWTNAWSMSDCNPGTPVRQRVRARPELRHLGRGHQPVRAAQPNARLVVPARLHRGQLERPGLQLRRHRGVP